jgi:hypothetical protein
MKIHELFDRDPRTAQLVNNGQARITGQVDARATEELRAELETFVCEGQFGDAIQRILERFLGQLGHTKQDAAWVSGFFGSGKSHLLKMLAHLWVNTTFADGSTARSLVAAGLPDEVEAQLRELDIQAKRVGLPTGAAAGTLLGGSGDRVRDTVLSIILRAGGWPSQYPQAMFCFWLRQQGWLDDVRAHVEAAGKDWLRELNNLHVSPLIAQAVLEAHPDFAADEKEVRRAIIQQFPQLSTDISTTDFIEAAKLALADDDGQLPLTIVVLDEVQQYINESSDRAAIITEVAEALQSQFDSRIMLVGAGQSALSAGTPALMWLRDRFRIHIELTDADVEAVTRNVLLRKRPSAVPEIEKVLENNAGEVARHLKGTKLAERAEDRRDRVNDYALLPTRRRFWEKCFQAADAAGTHSQLRSQLRILYDSLHDIANDDLGTVIPGSDLYTAIAPDLVNTGVLLNEIKTRVDRLDDGSAEGRMKRNLCGLIFLIGKLPREEGMDTGVRADEATLADLMVKDIRKDSGPFRKEVATLIEGLVDDGTLMRVGDEVRLQTTEGAEWDRAYRERLTKLRQNEVEIATRRDHLFGQIIQSQVGGVRLIHGEAKIKRTVGLHTGSDAPRQNSDTLTVWLRDGWATSEKEVLTTARQLGQHDPTIHLFLPKKSADQLKQRIVEAEAAQQVLDLKGLPPGDAGKEAYASMESRRKVAEGNRNEIVSEIVRATKVFQGGGAEVFGNNLEEKLTTAANASLARLFTRFGDGDHRGWEAAVKRAREGSDEPFKVVGWTGPTEEHPVAKEVLATIGSEATGSSIQKQLKASPYGWPQDAIDAALIALHRSGHLRAEKNHNPIPVGSLDQAGVKATVFKPEKVRLTTRQRIAARGLFATAGLTVKSGDEEIAAPRFIAALQELAGAAGGEPPLPAKPDLTDIEDLGRLAGAEQVAEILNVKDDLEKKIDKWTSLKTRAEKRSPVWGKAVALRRQAAGLEVLDEVGPELDAILAQRSLLDDTDQVTPLVVKLSGALRTELAAAHSTLAKAVTEAEKQLRGDATWKKLDDAAQTEILSAVSLAPPAVLKVASDDELLATLAATSLQAIRAEIDAVASRLARAIEMAAAQLAKKDAKATTSTVLVRKGTLSNEAAVDKWLEETKAKLIAAVKNGPVIVQ